MDFVTSVKLRHVGSEIGVPLPKSLVERLGVDAGDEMLVMDLEGGIYLTPDDPDFQQAYHHYQNAGRAYHEAIRELSRR
jgi:putative addiction module antidote